MTSRMPLRQLLGCGYEPRLFDLIALMGHESRVDEIGEPEASSGTTGQPGKSARSSGIAGLKASLTVLPDTQENLDDARAELVKLTADLPDGIDPAMMSDDDVLRALEFYRNR